MRIPSTLSPIRFPGRDAGNFQEAAEIAKDNFISNDLESKKTACFNVQVSSEDQHREELEACDYSIQKCINLINSAQVAKLGKDTVDIDYHVIENQSFANSSNLIGHTDSYKEPLIDKRISRV